MKSLGLRLNLIYIYVIKMTSRAYCFTYFGDDLGEKFEQLSINTEIKGYAVQVEGCPKTGRYHLQGFVRFNRPHRPSGAIALLNMKGCHIEKARGTDDQNIAYCTKEDSRVGPFKVEGTFASRGARTDLTALYESLKDRSFTMDDHYSTVAKYGKFYDRIVASIKPPSWRDVKVYWLWGAPGSGKTRYCHEFDSDLFAIPSYTPEWWDGYSDEKTVLLDDYDGTMKISRLLRILDGYRIQVPVKGGFRWLFATTIFITSNHPPNITLFTASEVQKEAVYRRITEIREVA